MTWSFTNVRVKHAAGHNYEELLSFLQVDNAAVAAVKPFEAEVSSVAEQPASASVARHSNAAVPGLSSRHTASFKTDAQPIAPRSLSTIKSLSHKGPEQMDRPPSRRAPLAGSDVAPVPVPVNDAIPASINMQDPSALQQQGSGVQKLRSLVTPAQQLREKDEQIAALHSTVQDLQDKLAAADQVKEACVSSAVESTKAALEKDLQCQATALTTARAELEACKSSSEMRELQHQVGSQPLLIVRTVSCDLTCVALCV